MALVRQFGLAMGTNGIPTLMVDPVGCRWALYLFVRGFSEIAPMAQWAILYALEWISMVSHATFFLRDAYHK